MTGQDRSGRSGGLQLEEDLGHMTQVTGQQSNAGNPPVALHHVQVGLQGRQEELQDFRLGQQLRGSSSNHMQPLQEVLIGQVAPSGGGEPRLRLHHREKGVKFSPSSVWVNTYVHVRTCVPAAASTYAFTITLTTFIPSETSWITDGTCC